MVGSGVSFPCLTVQIAAMWVTGILSERYARNVKKEFSVDCQRYVMDQNKDKQKLNDELLNNVAGGISPNMQQNYTCYTFLCNPQNDGCGNTFKSETVPDVCPYCGRDDTLKII